MTFLSLVASQLGGGGGAGSLGLPSGYAYGPFAVSLPRQLGNQNVIKITQQRNDYRLLGPKQNKRHIVFPQTIIDASWSVCESNQ